MDIEVCCCYVTMVIKVTPILETTPFTSGLWGLASCRVESCPVRTNHKMCNAWVILVQP